MAPVAVDLFSCSSIPKELVFCAEALRDFSGKQRGFSVGGGGLLHSHEAFNR